MIAGSTELKRVEDRHPKARKRRHDNQAGRTSDIVLISESNRAVGIGDKEFVHEHGLLHRAFSVLLTDAEGRFLLQRRSRRKYHSGGLWSNSCCGHPLPGEKVIAAARRRTFEELGIAPDLTFRFFARYSAALDNDMRENELVYVCSGSVRAPLTPDPDEIEEIQYLSLREIERLIRAHPREVTYWMKHYFSTHLAAVRRMSVLGTERARVQTARVEFT